MHILCKEHKQFNKMFDIVVNNKIKITKLAATLIRIYNYLNRIEFQTTLAFLCNNNKSSISYLD